MEIINHLKKQNERIYNILDENESLEKVKKMQLLN
jgi:hypothetical protein